MVRDSRAIGFQGKPRPMKSRLLPFLMLSSGVFAGCGDDANEADAATTTDAAVDGAAGDASDSATPPTVRVPMLGATQALAALQGRVSTPAAGQEDIGYLSTDLGHVVAHDGVLRVLFGDACADDACTPTDPTADDVQGEISLQDFPDGAAVDDYVAMHPAPSGEPSWQAAAPPVTMRVSAGGRVASIQVLRDGTPLYMGVFRAPTAAFSNGRDGMFALFARNVGMECSGGSEPTCEEGFTCDAGLGRCGGTSDDWIIPCELGTTVCACEAVAGGGYCQDRSSSYYDGASSDGRLLSIAQVTEIGNADPDVHEIYYAQPWYTHKFANPALRAVEDFDPARAGGAGNDYRIADGAGDTASEKVLIWGRPNLVGVRALGKDAKLYFAYADMPEYDPSGRFAWEPRYFTGLEDGVPQFSPAQEDAVPLDLSGGDDPTLERHDIVNNMSISFVRALDRWVMLYGGDLQGASLVYFVGAGALSTARDPEGAIHVRYASQPWGPWSPPEQVLLGGDPNVSPPVDGTQYGPGGILFHPECTTDCAPREPMLPTERGYLYGSYIVDPWTTERNGGAVDLYWNVSTWNPYGVVLMRTRIEP